MNVVYSNQPTYVEKDPNGAVFLVGPTPRDKNIPSWRPIAIQFFKEMGFKGTILVPEPSNGERYPNYDAQVNWEYTGLHNCNAILAWVPRDMVTMPALTTNVEFGYWMGHEPNKVMYGRPDYAVSTRYLDWMYEKFTQRKPVDCLRDLVYIVNFFFIGYNANKT